MNFRLTGILALAALLLGVAIVFWDRDEDSARQRLEQARRAFRFDAARVDRLVIESDNLSLECARRGRQWHLVRPLAARADPVAIERLLGALQELPRGDLLLPPRRAASDLAPYGFAPPRARIAIGEGAATNWIEVGRRTPLGDGIYVRQPAEAGMVRIPPDLLDLLPAGPGSWRDRGLLAGEPAGIQRLDLRTPASYIQLVRDDRAGWRLFQPLSARADPAAVTAIIEKLLACATVEFVQDNAADLAPYGLDGASAVVAALNTDTGDGTQMLSLGAPLPRDPALVYARLQGENSVHAVPQDVRQALLVSPDQLRDRRLPVPDPDDIRTLAIESGDQRLVLAREADGSWRMEYPVRAPADTETVAGLLRTWSALRLGDLESPGPDRPEDWIRTIRIEARPDRGPAIVLRVAPAPGGGARLAIAGDSAVARMDASALLDFTLDPLAYRSRDVLAVVPDDVTAVELAFGGQTWRHVRDPETGGWNGSAAWIADLLAGLAPLRAEALVDSASPAARGLDRNAPFLTLTLQLAGQTGLATTLWIGPELVPGGPRLATLRGRELLFTLSPRTVLALLPPAPAPAE